MAEKTCRTCLRRLPLESFYRNSGKKDGRDNHCSDCQKAKANTPEVRERKRLQARKLRKTNPVYLERQRANSRESAHRRRIEAREEILSVLGPVCSECGWDEVEILQIDHVDGGGFAQRKALGGHQAALMQIRNEVRAGSQDYQVLCPNCHTRKTLNQTWRKRAVA